MSKKKSRTVELVPTKNCNGKVWQLNVDYPLKRKYKNTKKIFVYSFEDGKGFTIIPRDRNFKSINKYRKTIISFKNNKLRFYDVNKRSNLRSSIIPKYPVSELLAQYPKEYFYGKYDLAFSSTGVSSEIINKGIITESEKVLNNFILSKINENFHTDYSSLDNVYWRINYKLFNSMGTYWENIKICNIPSRGFKEQLKKEFSKKVVKTICGYDSKKVINLFINPTDNENHLYKLYIAYINKKYLCVDYVIDLLSKKFLHNNPSNIIHFDTNALKQIFINQEDIKIYKFILDNIIIDSKIRFKFIKDMFFSTKSDRLLFYSNILKDIISLIKSILLIDDKTVFPKYHNPKQFHDDLSAISWKIKDKDYALNTSDKVIESGGWILKEPQTKYELIDWAKKLHNCMAGYCDRIINKETKIVCAFQNNELKYAIEIKNKNINQFYGNCNSQPDEIERQEIISILEEEKLVKNQFYDTLIKTTFGLDNQNREVFNQPFEIEAI